MKDTDSTASIDRPIIGVLCGGSSSERGISLNSARSAVDHLSSLDVDVRILFFDADNQPVVVPLAAMYSNTPQDFDHKLEQIGQRLVGEELTSFLRTIDLALPVIHGSFGEGGALQALLEEAGTPFVGSPEAACRTAYDKFRVNRHMAEQSFDVFPLELLGDDDSLRQTLEAFVAANASHGTFVVKPRRSGSSVGVRVVHGVTEAEEAAREVFTIDEGGYAVIEPFCRGREFTIVVVQGHSGDPVALVPVEVELDASLEIHDYRTKYLPTAEARYFIPPRFAPDAVAHVRDRAQRLFASLGLRDAARIDGWLLEDGSVVFSDVNIASGLEQNSFFFIESAFVGLAHQDVLRYLLNGVSRREGLSWTIPDPAEATVASSRTAVDVLFGGASSEANVSVMSGTNVWLKLRSSARYAPSPCLLEDDHTVWRLPYYLCLFHTVEEILWYCRQGSSTADANERLRAAVHDGFGDLEAYRSQTEFVPARRELPAFAEDADLVFLAVHGGIGENGDLQALFDRSGTTYTGSGAEASRLCMDKNETALAIRSLAGDGIGSARKTLFAVERLWSMSESELSDLWARATAELGGAALVAKPNAEGCSTGVARLSRVEDLRTYLEAVRAGLPRIPEGALPSEERIVELPPHGFRELLLEEYIETGRVSFRGQEVSLEGRSDWVEVTVGFVGGRGDVRVFPPSITVATKSVLTLEEKFQGGTGTNLTPPPPAILSEAVADEVRRRVALVVEELGVSGFGRIDAFVDRTTGHLLVIEANTIPALTPSTVLFQQALACDASLTPKSLLESILGLAERREVVQS